MKWIQKNLKTLIYIAFLVPIITVAIVSISHVTKWYGLSNPLSWAIYLSIGIEIAALSSLAAISASMGRKVYFPFGIVTLIQFIGNIFFAYQYIDVNGQSFKDWVDLVDPVVSFLGVESGNIVSHKRFLALFAGGMLPLISLSFLHMLVKFEEEEKNKSNLIKIEDDSELKTESEEEIIRKKDDLVNNVVNEEVIKTYEIVDGVVEKKIEETDVVDDVKEEIETLSEFEIEIDQIQKEKYKNLENVDEKPLQVDQVKNIEQPEIDKKVLNYRSRNASNKRFIDVQRIS